MTMEEITFSVLWFVTQELLGGLFWPLVTLVVVLALIVLAGLIRGRGRAWRLAALIGVVVAVAAGLLAPGATKSALAEVSQPTDWMALAGVMLGTGLGAALLVTGVLGLISGRNPQS
jgi:uncharacterized membrane protein